MQTLRVTTRRALVLSLVLSAVSHVGVAFAQTDPLLDIPQIPAATPEPLSNQPIVLDPSNTAAPSAGDEKLTPGVIASFGTFKRAKAIDTAGDQTPGEKPSPILAKVGRSASGRCSATVTNSSKTDTYSISFDVVGASNDGSPANKKSFSATLSPEKSVERTVDCRPGVNMSVVLRSGRKL